MINWIVQSKARIALSGGLLFAFIAVSGWSVFGMKAHRASVQPPQLAAAAEAKPEPQPFLGLDLEAASALVLDAESNNVLFSKDANSPQPLASITKVMTALVARERLRSESVIPITESALLTYGESGLAIGESWLIGDLTDFMLVTSSNDAAAALAEYAEAVTGENFVGLMNRRAQELGMADTVFRNPTGLDEGFEPGAVGSSRDVAKLFRYVIENEPGLMEATGKGAVFRNGRRFENTNAIATDLPGLLASKTGYTDTANGNLAIAFDAGLRQPVIVVVLGSSIEGRFRDVAKLVEASFNAILGAGEDVALNNQP